MLRWLPYPFVRIIIFFISGILLGIYLEEISAYHFKLIFLGLIPCMLGYLIIRILFKEQLWSGVLAFVMICMSGFLLSVDSLTFKPLPQNVSGFVAIVDSYPEEKERSVKNEVNIISVIDDSGNPEKYDGRAIIYTPKDNQLAYGDIIISTARLNEVVGPKNPSEFDYRQYLKYQGIHYQSFLKSSDYKVFGNEPPSRVIALAFRLRQVIELQIDTYLEKESAAVLKALVIGLRNGLDNELINAYASAGAIHVLAVSGLHVGIIYGLLLWSLGWMRKKNNGKIFFSILVLSTLWFYAFVTGFSPSVLRAVTMFSFIAVGQAIERQPSIYNSITASAFFLLFFNPLLITQVGFQLSYLAVIGIVYLYPKILRLWEPDNYILDRVWQLSCVGIAAQIATFPLGMYYFHQFPTYFLFSNLIVIPAATIILFSGIALLTLSWWSFVASLIGKFTMFMIMIMNKSVLVIEGLPMSIIDEIYIESYQLILLGLGVLFLIFTFSQRSIRAFYSFTVLSLILITSLLLKNHQTQDRSIIQLYSIYDNIVIDFIEGQEAYNFSFDPTSPHKFHTSGFRAKHHLEVQDLPEDIILEQDENRWIQWKNETYFIISATPENLSDLKFADVLYINNEAVESSFISKYFSGELIILGTANKGYYKDNLINDLQGLSVRVHDLGNSALTLIK